MGLLGAQRGMAGVADVSHGLLGQENGSMMQKWGIWGQILGCHDQTLPLLPNFAAKQFINIVLSLLDISPLNEISHN